MSRWPRDEEEVYADGHAVAFMALLARQTGKATFTSEELLRVQGTIIRKKNRDGTVTYRIAADDSSYPPSSSPASPQP